MLVSLPKLGLCMKTFKLCDWSMNAPLLCITQSRLG